MNVVFIESYKHEDIIDKTKSTPLKPAFIGNLWKYTARVMVSCITFKHPSVAMIEFNYKHLYDDKQVKQLLDNSHFDSIKAKLIQLWPEPPKPYCHISVPEKVRAAFATLQRTYRNPLNEAPSIIIGGCRLVLDVVIQDKGGVGHDLKTQIDSLADKGIVAGVLRDWAHQLRYVGNKAVHELEGTKEEADDLVKFLGFLLMYLYELPYEIDRARLGEEAANEKWEIKTE
jgi:hypothetical protein